MTAKNIDFWLNEKELKTPIHDEMVLFTFNNADKIIGEFNDIFWPIEKYREDSKIQIEKIKTIEFPLKGYNGFNLGYLDLMVTYNIINGGTFLSKEYCENERKYRRLIGFEIKPEVKSIGEVLRQFQYYKSNLPPHTRLILVTKTKGLKEVFESQGFYVYEYKNKGLQQQTI